MAQCSWCNASMPDERVEFYSTCIQCTDQSTPIAFNNFSHKTAPELVLVKSSNKEAVRQARNANIRRR